MDIKDYFELLIKDEHHDFDVSSFYAIHHLYLISKIIDYDDIEFMNIIRRHFYKMRFDFPKYPSVDGYRKRMVTEKFWRSQISKNSIRLYEHEEIKKGYVNKHHPYITDKSLERYVKKQVENRKRLSKMRLVSSAGDELNLLDVVDKSLSNPVNRQSEMLIKIKGLEKYADSIGYDCVFFTLTCPSKYHPTKFHKTDVVLNDKYDGSSPREANAYLNSIWARFRAYCDDNGLKIFGTMISEPHKDACPHRHPLIFMPSDQVDDVIESFRNYALEEDSDELGADKYRFKAVKIDRSKGSAVGYVIKYVSKNLGVEAESLKFDHSDHALRVKAWAGVWGIRQFQFFGTPSQAVWRQFWSMDSDKEYDCNGLIDNTNIRVESRDYAGFLENLGGPCLRRKDYLIQTVKSEFKNRFGEIVKKTVGIASSTVEVITKTKQWQIISPKHNFCHDYIKSIFDEKNPVQTYDNDGNAFYTDDELFFRQNYVSRYISDFSSFLNSDSEFDAITFEPRAAVTGAAHPCAARVTIACAININNMDDLDESLDSSTWTSVNNCRNQETQEITYFQEKMASFERRLVHYRDKRDENRHSFMYFLSKYENIFSPVP